MSISHKDLMLATSASKPFSDPRWIFEPKYDGYRILVYCEKRKARLVTRNGIDLAGYFPEIVDVAALRDCTAACGRACTTACRISDRLDHTSRHPLLYL